MRPTSLVICAIAAAACFVLACDDNSTSPDLSQGYVIRATLGTSLQTARINVIRVDPADPSVLSALVVMNGEEVSALPNGVPGEAIFEHQVAFGLGQSHSFSVRIGGKASTGILATPAEACTITITQPPPEALTFTPGVDLNLAWDYVGSESGQINVLGLDLGTLFPRIVSDTLQASARSTVIPTDQWQLANQVLIRITARTREAIAGDLAAPTSLAQVDFASSEIILDRR